jgi:hypothetical protein
VINLHIKILVLKTKKPPPPKKEISSDATPEIEKAGYCLVSYHHALD